jgi:hypothetical protein
MTEYTAPTTLPKLAGEDTANISEPISDIKDDGWEDEAIPTAKNWNWFAHWAYKWIKYFSEALSSVIPVEIGTVTLTIVGSDEGTIDMDYIKFANGIVSVSLPLSDAKASATATLVASGTPIPASIRPVNHTGAGQYDYVSIPMVFIIGGITSTITQRPGVMIIGVDGAVSFWLYKHVGGADGMQHNNSAFGDNQDVNDHRGWLRMTGNYRIAV